MAENPPHSMDNPTDSVSLKTYIDAKVGALYKTINEKDVHYRAIIELLESKHEQHFALIEKALMHAEKEMERRLEGMNELRAQILSERGQYVTREILEEKLSVLGERLIRIEQLKSNLEGRLWMLGAVIVALTVVLNLVFAYLNLRK